jgi:hypothetical protein
MPVNRLEVREVEISGRNTLPDALHHKLTLVIVELDSVAEV